MASCTGTDFFQLAIDLILTHVFEVRKILWSRSQKKLSSRDSDAGELTG